MVSVVIVEGDVVHPAPPFWDLDHVLQFHWRLRHAAGVLPALCNTVNVVVTSYVTL